MDNSGDNGQNYDASMFDRVRDSERQRRINGDLADGNLMLISAVK